MVSEAYDPDFSHMNIVATGDEKTIVHIIKQLNKLVDVVHAADNTGKDVIQRELALVKVRCPPEKRTEVLDVVHTFKGQVVDLAETALTVQVTGNSEKVDALHRMLGPLRGHRDGADGQGHRGARRGGHLIMGKNPSGQGVGPAQGGHAALGAGPALHRPAPRPRGHLAAGLPGAEGPRA